MKVKDCKEIRRQIDEANPACDLSEDAKSHLRRCSSCQDFYQSGSKLRQIMASLAPVDAPADFDFHLSARLANERIGSRWRLTIGRKIGVPSVAIAALLFLGMGVFLFRTVTSQKQQPQISVFSAEGQRAVGIVGQSLEPQRPSAERPAANLTVPRTASQNRRPNTVGRKGLAVSVNTDGMAREDLSNVGATVVKRNDSIAAVQLPLIFPIQTLRVSLDDGRGGSRTISFPSVSFGSERVLNRPGSSFQAPTKGDW